MIEVRNWNKSFGKNHVLRNVNCKIETGEVVVMLGASGSGKSTFLRTLNFLEKAESGTLIMDDLVMDMSHVRKRDILTMRRQTAMVFQSYNLFRHKTALENVMEALVVVKKMNKDEARKIAEAELTREGLADRMHYYPHQLSGGQQQRVGIARAFVCRPKVVFADEPTGNLDSKTTLEVMELMVDMARRHNQTIVLVTHDTELAAYADRIITLVDGNVVEDRTNTPCYVPSFCKEQAAQQAESPEEPGQQAAE